MPAMSLSAIKDLQTEMGQIVRTHSKLVMVCCLMHLHDCWPAVGPELLVVCAAHVK